MRDLDIRKKLLACLDIQHKSEADTAIVQEMGIWSGSVRVDIAVINGELSGFELKSDQDTLSRLPFQIEIYGHVFDRMNLVVGERHFEAASLMIPEWWGITLVESSNEDLILRPVRNAKFNPNLNPYLIAQLLWKEEAIHILDEFASSKGWKARRVKEIHSHASEIIPVDTLRKAVRDRLKARVGWLRKYGSN